MQTRRRDPFRTVRSEGALLPPELLQRVADGDQRLGGLTPADYHLPEGEKLRAAIERAWGLLLGRWAAFQALPAPNAGQSGTGQTREKWLYPLFEQLGYGWLKQMVRREPIILGEDEADHYPISHRWGQHTPLHLIGVGVELDRRTPGVREHREDQRSPHSLVQELLNRTGDRHLWAVVSNGRRLRLLRNNASFTRQAFVEFDLEGMFNGQVFADFALLWLLVHSSRLEGERPADCWLERWHKGAEQAGVVALDRLRDGVRAAIETLGRGFLSHPANDTLRAALRDGWLPKEDFYRHVLRLVYRLLFLFVAEDRGLLAPPDADPKAVERYRRYYSTARLRDLAGKRCGSDHHDLYHSLVLVMARLDQTGCPELALPALGSLLWSAEALSVGERGASAPCLSPNRGLTPPAHLSPNRGLTPPAHLSPNRGLTPPAHLDRRVSLMECRLSNKALLEAVYELAYIVDGKVRRPVDYKNLGSEELGSVYESLLEQNPQVDLTAPSDRLFELREVAGSERKQAGAYYTPTSLIQCLLDSALDPVLDEACRQPDPAQALLALKVCDPACGSGHFLIAAAWRIARRLASVRSGESEATPEAVRSALREVIGRCIYGVDINPMAAELCKVALWIEALDPGKPLSFLDHHIRVGNSLLGATPALLKDGIPDAAFEPIEGDDKAVCKAYRKQNKEERQGYGNLFEDAAPWEQLGNLTAAMQQLNLLPEDSVADVRRKEELFRRYDDESSYRTSGRFLADLWCAAFVWKKTREFDYPITERLFRRVWKNPHDVQPWMYQEVRRLAEEYQFFHWHLAYPDVFRVPAKDAAPENEQTGWTGGFDVVLGNPPWERIKLQEQEWFAERRPDIANARNAAQRRRMIAELAEQDPALYRAFLEDRRQAEGESHFVRHSGRYPLTGRGDVNTYALFAETNRMLLNSRARAGFIIQSDIATADTYKEFFADLLAKRQLLTFYDFVNTEGLFPHIHRTHPHFCLITLSSRASGSQADFAFWNTNTTHLSEPNRHFTLSAEDIALVNPNTRTCPIFRNRRDAELTKAIYRRVPVLIKEGLTPDPSPSGRGVPEGRGEGGNPWGVQFLAMFHMANDSHLFTTENTESTEKKSSVFSVSSVVKFLPLYEAKMLHQFDHRWATYDGLETRDLTDEEKRDPSFVVQPRYWVPAAEVEDRLRDKWDRRWLLGWRDICRNTDERTVIASILPRVGVGHTMPLFLIHASAHPHYLVAILNSLVLDFVTRQKVGGTHLTYNYIEQLPVLPPAVFDQPCPWAGFTAENAESAEKSPASSALSASSAVSYSAWLRPRVLELTYTAWDLQPFAEDLGYAGPPFRWDEERRFLLRCELDAAFFHLYGINREDAAYILDTFPIVRRKDEERHGEYRTKRVILEIYDALAEAAGSGRPYQTRLDPPPRAAHSQRQGSSAPGNAVDSTQAATGG